MEVRIPWHLSFKFDPLYRDIGFIGYAESSCDSSAARERGNSLPHNRRPGWIYGAIGDFYRHPRRRDCIGSRNGRELWKTKLKGADFVNVLLDNDRVLAATKGQLLSLDAATGQLLWYNELPSAGWGVIAIATASGSSSPVPPIREKQRCDEAASGAGVAAAL